MTYTVAAPNKKEKEVVTDVSGNLLALIPGMIIEYKKKVRDKVKAVNLLLY